MDIFTAIAEPTRRTIVELLAKSGTMPASEIYEQFDASAPAISQHLKVLRQAELVRVEKQAQKRLYSVNQSKVQEFEAWAQKITQLWRERMERLDALLQEEVKKENQSPEK